MAVWSGAAFYPDWNAAVRCPRPMRLQKLREEVLETNLELVRKGLVLYTFGNASGISREQNLVAIKLRGSPGKRLPRNTRKIPGLRLSALSNL